MEIRIMMPRMRADVHQMKRSRVKPLLAWAFTACTLEVSCRDFPPNAHLPYICLLPNSEL